ncbi:MAG: hypothetical protein KGI83_02800 [Verrucomicrobiota bacterium]|nr:hypothetical protein [Verrucomicrobiota bacterium]
MAARKKKNPNPAQAKSAVNKTAQWKAFHQLQKQADLAWKKFHHDVKSHADAATLIEDQNHMLLLLGECNYMARECMRIASIGKKRDR